MRSAGGRVDGGRERPRPTYCADPVRAVCRSRRLVLVRQTGAMIQAVAFAKVLTLPSGQAMHARLLELDGAKLVYVQAVQKLQERRTP